jgi:iron complex transport system ATP-binding protein
VGTGDWTTVIGPNGAGKTTLLRALAGIVPCTGRVEHEGFPLGELSRRQRARRFGFVAQAPSMPPGMTVEQYALLGRSPHLRPLGAEQARDFAVVHRALAQLGLTKLARREVQTLSGGERQRTALARALAQEPHLLLLDEPTSALDIGHQQEVLELVDRLRQDLGLTVVSTMHDLTAAAGFGQHLIMLVAGSVVASGPPVQVLSSPQLAAHYGADVDVISHRRQLVVVPLRPDPSPDPTESRGEE